MSCYAVLTESCVLLYSSLLPCRKRSCSTRNCPPTSASVVCCCLIQCSQLVCLMITTLHLLHAPCTSTLLHPAQCTMNSEQSLNDCPFNCTLPALSHGHADAPMPLKRMNLCRLRVHVCSYACRRQRDLRHSMPSRRWRQGGQDHFREPDLMP